MSDEATYSRKLRDFAELWRRKRRDGRLPSQRDFAAFDVALTPGTKLPPPTGVFPRLQDAAAS